MRGGIARPVLAAVAGYVANAVLIAISETVLLRAMSGPRYLVADLATQCVYTVAAGALCGWMARERWRMAAVLMASLGLAIGGWSLLQSWRAEPHWYGIALLSVYPPCVWVGCKLSFSIKAHSGAAR